MLMTAVQISLVVRAFHYNPRTALAVGLSMAQIGEFAFVLLSVASQLGLLPYQVYMLLMGMLRFDLAAWLPGGCVSQNLRKTSYWLHAADCSCLLC